MAERARALMIVMALASTAQSPATDASLQSIANTGWAAARALALKGGAVDQLGPVNQRLKELDGLMNNLGARYADVAIRAAVSAAQDERDEMALFLTHARALSDQMVLANLGPARWPLPIDELEGELWLEVDRYEESRDAYLRATDHGRLRQGFGAQGGASVWMGLARASDHLGDTQAACDAYRTARSQPGITRADQQEIDSYVSRCQN